MAASCELHYSHNRCSAGMVLSFYSQDLMTEDPTTHGAMFVPVILGSDKTTVSVATGQNEYYPLYLSIGNVHNTVRRAHRDAVQVLAFLAIAKGKYDLISSDICFNY